MTNLKNERQEIIDAIEYSMHMYSEVEGVFEKIPFENLGGYRCTIVDFEEFNSVGRSRLDKNQLEDTIKKVIDHFTSVGLTKIAWIVSPQSTPSNLIEKLESNGFKKEIPVLGMYRPTEKEFDITVTEEFEFKEYTIDEALKLLEDPKYGKMIEKAYGMPEGASNIMKMMTSFYQGIEFASYYAYDKANNEPVGFSAIAYVPGTKIALLNGAATLPEHRGKGIYSAMVKLRHEKAKKDGIENLIIQAKEETSAPIASKYGFEKVCELPFYVWRKE